MPGGVAEAAAEGAGGDDPDDDDGGGGGHAEQGGGDPGEREEGPAERGVVVLGVAEDDQGGVGEDGPQQREPDPAVPDGEPVHPDATVQPGQPGDEQQLEHD